MVLESERAWKKFVGDNRKVGANTDEFGLSRVSQTDSFTTPQKRRYQAVVVKKWANIFLRHGPDVTSY
jgi:hypothetical protein